MKLKVLAFVGTYIPGYKGGGPIRSIANLAAALGDEIDFEIITGDRDLGDRKPYEGIQHDTWMQVGKAKVMYLRPGLRGVLKIISILRTSDENRVVYLNSFFSRKFSMLPMWLRWTGLCKTKYMVIAPRGEFSLGSLELKPIRKWLYLKLCRLVPVYNRILWHASSGYESQDIQRQFPRVLDLKNISETENVTPMATSSYLMVAGIIATALDIAAPFVPIFKLLPTKEKGKLDCVFISRISRKKNLPFALKILHGVKGQVAFRIYGPIEDKEFWAECQAVTETLPPNIEVRYCGELEHQQVKSVLTENHLFLFPTLGENFGHVIHEAIFAGRPVLISDQTPWRNLEQEGAGWDLPLNDPSGFSAVIQKCVDMDSEDYAKTVQRVMHYAAELSRNQDAVMASRKLFFDLVGR